MRLRCLALILIPPLLILASLGVRALPQRSAPDKFELRGKVINAMTGEPVSGALIQVPGQPSRFSADDGTFVLTDLASGRIYVRARKPGFFNQEDLGPGFDSWIDVPSSYGITVKLSPEGIIYGEVKDANGQPLDGVAVRAERWRASEGRGQLTTERETTSDDEGNFRLAELSPGRYYLAFLPASHGWSTQNGLRSKRKSQEGYARQFYPGVTDRAAATTFQIRPGAQLHVSHSIVKQRLFEVSGTVRGVAPADNFTVMVTGDSGDPVQRNVHINPTTGEFQIPGIPAGTFMLTALFFGRTAAADSSPEPLQAMLLIHVAEDLSGLVLVPGRGAEVPVRLQDESSSSDNAPHQVYLNLLHRDFDQFGSTLQLSTPPAAPNAPTGFQHLAPGAYSVQATAPYGYIASLRCGSIDLLRDDLVIAPGSALPAIDVTLRDDSAQLSVSLNQKNRSAAVIIYSEEYPSRSILSRPNPGAGSVSAPFLPPGTYQVIALAGANDVEFRNPAVMERFLNQAKTVTLQPRDSTALTVDVQDAAERPQ